MTNTTVVGSELAQAGEEVAHVLAGDLVEGRERLVHQQQRRAERHRPHEGDALLHPPGQLVRVGVGELGETDLGEKVAGRARRVARGVAVDLEEQAGVAGDGAPGEQGRRLRHEPDTLGEAGCVRAAAVDLDDAGARLVEPADEPQQRRLAAAGGAEDGDDLSGCDVEVDQPQRFEATEELGDPAHADRRRHQPEGIGGVEPPTDLGGTRCHSRIWAAIVCRRYGPRTRPGLR